MITKEQAMTMRYFITTSHNKEGMPRKVRASGKCQTWKTRPDEFKLPIKHGLYEHGYITHENAHLFMVEPPRHVIDHALQFCKKEKIRDAKEVHRIIMQSIADYYA